MRLSLLALVSVAVTFASCLLPFASSFPSSTNEYESTLSTPNPTTSASSSPSSVFPFFTDPRVQVHRVDENHYGLGPETALNWAGYISVNQTRHLWYWFFESRQDPTNDPFVLWMTGGPGCSSLVALFAENGPYHIQKDLSLSINPHSWNSRANILYIDQPVNTGFSYSDAPLDGIVNEDEMAANMYEFLQNFLVAYPKYANNPFFVTGESYAGHYVPALSRHIFDENQEGKNPKINLHGIAIGNGLVSPRHQYGYYADYALDHGVISSLTHALMKATLPVCLGLINNCISNSTVGYLACIAAYEACNLGQVLPIQLTGANVYDVREKCEVPPLCYDFSDVSSYLALPDVQKALNVTGRSWESCNRAVALRLVFAGDWMLDFETDIPVLLAGGVSVLVYNGEDDFVCNWYGSQNWVHQLVWPGQQEFNSATNTTWTVDGTVAGSSISAQGLTFLRVKDAGHMVPMNQPRAAKVLLDNLLDNKPFGSEAHIEVQ